MTMIMWTCHALCGLCPPPGDATPPANPANRRCRDIVYMLDQPRRRWTDIQAILCQTFVSARNGQSFPANTRPRPNVGPMLVHRLRRWPNIGPTLGRYLVFAGLVNMGLSLQLFRSAGCSLKCCSISVPLTC